MTTSLKRKKKSDEEAKETQNCFSHSAHTIFSFFIVLHLSLRLTLVRSLKEKYALILPQFPSPNFSTPSFSLFDSSSVHNCNTKSMCVTKRSTAVSHWQHLKLLQIKSQTLRCTTGVDITQIKQTPRKKTGGLVSPTGDREKNGGVSQCNQWMLYSLSSLCPGLCCCLRCANLSDTQTLLPPRRLKSMSPVSNGRVFARQITFVGDSGE